MKFRIYSDKVPEKEIYFELHETKGKDGIYLVSTDKSGSRSQTNPLLKIDSDGITLSTFIDKNVGIPLDEMGRIKICK